MWWRVGGYKADQELWASGWGLLVLNWPQASGLLVLHPWYLSSCLLGLSRDHSAFWLKFFRKSPDVCRCRDFLRQQERDGDPVPLLTDFILQWIPSPFPERQHWLSLWRIMWYKSRWFSAFSLRAFMSCQLMIASFQNFVAVAFSPFLPLWICLFFFNWSKIYIKNLSL